MARGKRAQSKKRTRSGVAALPSATAMGGSPEQAAGTLDFRELTAGEVGRRAVNSLVAAQKRDGIRAPITHFWLAPAQRELLMALPGMPVNIRAKLGREALDYDIAEVAGMLLTLAEALPKAEPMRQRGGMQAVAMHLIERLESIEEPQPVHQRDSLESGEEQGGGGGRKASGGTRGRSGAAARRKAAGGKTGEKSLFQFKITLEGLEPPIWRRIVIEDCTLDQLHQYIQAAMGWTDSHLHQFVIDRRHYSNPEMLDGHWSEEEDSRQVRLCDLIAPSRRRVRFKYEYDFGDGWRHEILFEGFRSPEPGARYPVCLEGERACPPEDVGGIWGYADLLEVHADPKHQRYQHSVNWLGENFDPENFDARKATKALRART